MQRTGGEQQQQLTASHAAPGALTLHPSIATLPAHLHLCGAANAFDDRFTPGGSSCGSAVAVAEGMCTFALGTDTAGSGGWVGGWMGWLAGAAAWRAESASHCCYSCQPQLRPDASAVLALQTMPLPPRSPLPAPAHPCPSPQAACLLATTASWASSLLWAASLPQESSLPATSWTAPLSLR